MCVWSLGSRSPPGPPKSRWSRIDGGATVSPTQSGAPLTTQVLGVTETHRSEEPIGAETRRIDNTAGASRLTRTMRVTREWSRTVSLDLNASHGVSVGAQIGPNWLELRTNVEQTLSRTYTVSASRLSPVLPSPSSWSGNGCGSTAALLLPLLVSDSRATGREALRQAPTGGVPHRAHRSASQLATLNGRIPSRASPSRPFSISRS